MSILRRLQDHPRLLERAYRATSAFMRRSEPLLRKIGFVRLAPIFIIGEKISKKALFDCRMCGSCVLHSTGMTCPMTCPKNLRNGPCGGVRADGKCEVKPDMDCIWVLAWQRSAAMTVYRDEILLINRPLDRRLEGTSAWLNMLDQADEKTPENWINLHDIPTVITPQSHAN